MRKLLVFMVIASVFLYGCLGSVGQSTSTSLGPCGFLEGAKPTTTSNYTATAPSASGTNGTTAPAATHKACQSNKCVAVSGAGSDECTYDSDCTSTDACGQQTSCPSCLGTVGCGWCQSTSTCVSGSGSGPSSGSCSEWSFYDCIVQPTPPTQPTQPAQNTTPPPPSAPTSCSGYTDCSGCLKTGAGKCKWCIQGSICTDVSDTSTQCTFGPTAEKWLTKDYQCALASR